MSAITFNIEDLKSPDRLERVLRQFEQNMNKAIPATIEKTIQQVVTQVVAAAPSASFVPPPGSTPGTPLLAEDTHANRLANYASPVTKGSQFWETDRTVLYTAVTSGSSLVWEYTAGAYLDVIANRPADLTTTDKGFLFYATDQSTAYIWTGAAFDTTTRRILIGGFFAIFAHANTADRTYTFIDSSGNIAVIADSIALTNKAADIGSTNFANSGAGSTFRVSYDLETTTADGAAGTVTVTFAYTDDAGATTTASTALALTALGRTTGVFYIQRASGNVAYSTSHTGIYGTSKYALYAALERLS